MFNNLDTSVLDDSTGLKLLNYLTRGDDKERLPRTRNRLFRLQATESSVDDFSIRQVKGKENTNAQQTPAAAPASPRRSTIPAQPQERSSLFVSSMPQQLHDQIQSPPLTAITFY